MRYQEQIVKLTQHALEDVCRAASALPPEAATWNPGGAARSALAQMQELARSATWLLPLVTERSGAAFADHPDAATGRNDLPSVEAFDSMEGCVSAARRSTALLCQAISTAPEDALDEELRLPFGDRGTLTFADLLAMHYWNLTYHLGQVNQIALVFGDRAMH